MSSYDNINDRLTDLRTSAAQHVLKALNHDGGMWEKFAGDVTKPTDKDVFDFDAIEELFDREALGTDYANALDDMEPASNVIKPKRCSDALASMQQALRLRGITPIRALCASLSRQRSMYEKDIEAQRLELTQ